MIFTTGGTIDSQIYNACMHRKGYISSQIPGKFLHTGTLGVGMFLHTFGVVMFYTRNVGNFLHVHTLDVPMFLNALDEGTCILVCFYMLSMTVYISTCFRCYCRYVFTCFRCRYVSTYFRCSYISTYMYFRYRYVSYILVL